uniref:Uncharacterized protein n=1 Tax=Plectus sambesii TaxID=2011161 RepID=A0A914VSS8_9BILA
MGKGKGRGRSKKKKETAVELPLLHKTENERTSDNKLAQAAGNAQTSLIAHLGAQAYNVPDGTVSTNNADRDKPSVDPNGQQDTFNSHNYDGRNVSGVVSARIVVQGDYHAYSHDPRQPPPTFSSTTSQPSAEDQQQEQDIEELKTQPGNGKLDADPSEPINSQRGAPPLTVKLSIRE